MSIFRSYFSKNATLIENNITNNSQNPVTEISYGTLNEQVSRFILDIDFDNLRERIIQGLINPNNIEKHVLHLTNTISYASQYIGQKSYSDTIERASSFDLELFNVNQDWDEGSGYDFVYDDYLTTGLEEQVPNWYSGKTGVSWDVDGLYSSGVTKILGTERFEKGNENIDIDITDYVNQRLFGTGYTGTTIFTGTSYGVGIKFPDAYEEIETEFRQAVGFHAKETNTAYEPYLETTIDDTIVDDRNYFYLDKDNDLYLYVNSGGIKQNVTVNSVKIYDNEDNLLTTITGDSIVNVQKGVYKVTINVDSDSYPDAVIFRDEWSITNNNRETTHDGEFYLISQDKYLTFDQSNQIVMDNYYFYFWGIGEREKIRNGGIRKIKLTIKELYPNQNIFLPLDIEYRLFMTVGSKYEVDIIPFTQVNRTNSGYYFNLDTSWLIPQDYKLQIRLKNGDYYENKETLSFTVVNDGILNV